MQQKQHSSAVGIQLSSSLSALGNCPEQLHQRLTLPETSLSIQSEWLPERSVWVGAYTGHLIENFSVHDKFHRTLILSGFCLLKIAKISLNSSFFPKPIKR